MRKYNNEKRNETYARYVPSVWICLVSVIGYEAFVLFLGYTLFRSFIAGFVMSICLYPLFAPRFLKYIRQRRVNCLEREFCEAVQLMASSLAAGRSIEFCFYEIGENAIYNNKTMKLICDEFKKISRRIFMNYSPEFAFAEFAQKSGSADIKAFGNALEAAISSGGNMVALMRNYASMLRVKYEAQVELKNILALPKYNNKVITVMPFLLLYMMRLISPEYIEPLYYGAGRIVMICVFITISGAWWFGEKIGDVKY